jgi:hypothetical protein
MEFRHWVPVLRNTGFRYPGANSQDIKIVHVIIYPTLFKTEPLDNGIRIQQIHFQGVPLLSYSGPTGPDTEAC